MSPNAILFSLYHKSSSNGEYISFLHYALTTLYNHNKNPSFDIVVYMTSDIKDFSFNFAHLKQFNLIKDFPNVRFEYSDYALADGYMAKWYHLEKAFNLGYSKILYLDCDVIFLKDPSYLFDKYSDDKFWCLYEVSTPITERILGCAGMNSGHFLMNRTLFRKVYKFFNSVTLKRISLTEQAVQLLRAGEIEQQELDSFSFFNEQYCAQMVLKDFNIDFEQFDRKEIDWGPTKPNTIWHYTAAAGREVLPSKYF